ncbi:protein translocase SecDF, variant type [Mesoplasma photuris]|uniref:protein translocase SecDF, variant type n=1 Tax=Mesoplasma photuris TaxID=217731 RepID=UPI0004E1913A|nr:protein translocase SecDF, variant type [Mesoplasma photuris]
MKDKKNPKKIVRILALSLIVASLIAGIIFSSIFGFSGIKLGSKYSGGYEALVGVYDDQNENTSDTPNGDASKAAEALEKKLSPFSDNTIDIIQEGKSRLQVRATKDAYNYNIDAFSRAIEMNGGIVLLNSNYQDILFDKEIMDKLSVPVEEGSSDDGKIVVDYNGSTTIKNKLKVSDILGDVSVERYKSGNENKPYLKFDLSDEEIAKNGYLEKIIAPAEEEQPTKATNESLTFVTSIENVLTNIREYYSLAPTEEEQEDYIETFWLFIRNPLNNIADEATRKILKDFFTGSIVNEDGSVQKVSLLSYGGNSNTDDFREVTSFEAFEEVLEQGFSFKENSELNNSVSRYVYDTNAVSDDFNINNDEGKKGKYSEDIKSVINGEVLGKSVTIFNTLTNNLFKEVLFKDANGGFNSQLNYDFFKENLILSKDVISPTPSIAVGAFLEKENEKTTGLMLKAPSYTIAERNTAVISQSTLGIHFKVLAIKEFDATIKQYALIITIIILLILMLALFIYMLYAYRILGLFTIIIAVIIGSLVIFATSWFNVAVGPELWLILLLLIGLVIDIASMYIESIKNNIYREKHSIEASMKISGKETLGMSLDAAIVALIPNIVLFWIGSGVLKNFATITAFGAIAVIVFGIVLFRIMTRLFLKSELFKNKTWLLPIDNFERIEGNYFLTIKIDHYKKVIKYLTEKEKTTTKELLRLKSTTDKLLIAENKSKELNDKRKAKADQKLLLRLEKSNNKIAKLEAKPKSKLTLINKVTDLRSEEAKFINKDINLNIQYSKNPSDNSQEQIENNRLIKLENKTKLTSKIIFIIVGILAILSLSVGLTVGPKANSSFGSGKTFIIYGEQNIESNYNTMTQGDGIFGIITSQKVDGESLDEVKAKAYANDVKKIVSSTQNDHAQGVSKGYEYIISNDLLKWFNPKIKNKTLYDVQIKYGNDFLTQNPNGTEVEKNAPWISISTTSKMRFREFKDILRMLSGTQITPDGKNGVLGMQQNPYTASGQIVQAAIMTGFVLLALLIYMIIRFKWTYYVALALSLILIVGITVASVIVFQVPIGSEVISAIVVTISFAMISAIIVLGKGKSLLSAKGEKTLSLKLSEEIELAKEINVKNRSAKTSIDEINKKYNSELKEIKSQLKNLLKDQIEDKEKLKEEIRMIKFNKKTEIELEKNAFKTFKKDTKREINNFSNKNNFIKDTYLKIVKFAIIRSIVLGSIYLIISIVLAFTMIDVIGMGITLAIGIIVTAAVIVSIMIPLWMWLERRRISAKLGYKKFIGNIEVSNEEQIVEEIND